MPYFDVMDDYSENGKRDDWVTLRIPKDLKKTIKEIAATQHRSLNGQCLHYIERGIAHEKETAEVAPK